ncbi:Hypothetical predicted protein [Pelobates cultripes]|uniref:Uncharacterized protein n=1 Tax=Pelobates cultripes TaxID=61616 RepID=A0AAD1TA32_PELCU|nr:Hypothetical predicted protein [Pelobates cultripes]
MPSPHYPTFPFPRPPQHTLKYMTHCRQADLRTQPTLTETPPHLRDRLHTTAPTTTSTHRIRDEPTRQDCPNAQYPRTLYHNTRNHSTLTTRNSTRSTNTPPTLTGALNRHRRTPDTEVTPQQDNTPTHDTHTTTAYTHYRTATSTEGTPAANAHTGQNYLTDPRPPNAPLLDNCSPPSTPTDLEQAYLTEIPEPRLPAAHTPPSPTSACRTRLDKSENLPDTPPTTQELLKTRRVVAI